MAYQRNGGGNQGGNQGGGPAKPAYNNSKPANQSGRSSGPQQSSRPPQQQQPQQQSQQNNQQGGQQGQSGGGTKPTHRLALQEKSAEGKWVAVKGEDGKTVYVGSGWDDNYGGINIIVNQDIPTGTRVRAYSAERRDQPK